MKGILPLSKFNPLNDRFAFYELDFAGYELETLFKNIGQLRIQE